MCRKLIPLALSTSTALDRSHRFFNAKSCSFNRGCWLSPQHHSNNVFKSGAVVRSSRNTATIMSGRRLSNILLPSKEKDPNLVLLILNWKLSPVTRRLFDTASLRICADGGANRLYDYCALWEADLSPSQARSMYTPDIIKGDLDSLRPDVKNYYIECGVTIVDLSDDEDTTDLQKCVNFAIAQLRAAGNLDSATFVAVGGLGGRLDHTLSNLNLLHKLPNVRMVLCGDGNLAELIRPGTTVVEVDKSIHGPACGLVALKAPAKVTTTGLTWDCDNLTLEVGGMQSTSNRLKDDEITVTTDQPLIWTVEFRDGSPE